MYLLLGMLAYFLIDFATFSKSVPGLTQKFEKLKQYLDLNMFFILAGLILGFTIVSLDSLADLPFLSDLGFPISQSPQSAFILGLLNQWIVIKIRKFKNSLIVETKDDVIVQTKDITKK